MERKYKEILNKILNIDLAFATDKQMKQFNKLMDELKQLKEGNN